MTGPSPTVYIVDDDLSVLKSLKRLLRSAGFSVETFVSPHAFLEDHDGDTLGCAVFDLSMPGLNGLELQQALASRGSRLPIIFLTGRGDLHSGVQAMKDGAVDFLTKPVDDQELLAAVKRAIERSRTAHDDDAAREQLERRLASLTPREREVFGLVVAGMTNKQVGEKLGATEKTIKVHRARVMQKMEAATLSDLVRIGMRLNIAVDLG